MRLDRVFCRLCQCPVVDGGVQASEVDKERFEEWCLDVMDEELVDELEEGDVICNFCVWDAEILLESREMNDIDRFKWWPSKEDFGSLKINYQVEKVKPCWVLLEKVSLPESDEEIESEVCQQDEKVKIRKKCFYCGKQMLAYSISSHIKRKHKDVAIRCDFEKCNTYFYTLDDKKKHIVEYHEKPMERKTFDCIYCGKIILRGDTLRNHVQSFHSELAIRCNLKKCHSYFKSQIELESHINFVHVKNFTKNIFQCSHCEFKTHKRLYIENHISYRHLIKTISCQNCDKMFSTSKTLKEHTRKVHKFKVCNICHLNVPAGILKYHCNKKLCKSCKNLFPCSGVLQSHKKLCKEKLLTCVNCPKKFKIQSQLDYHIKARHKNLLKSKKFKNCDPKYKSLGFECESCEKYFSREEHLKNHLNSVHYGLKFACAHCSKKYRSLISMKYHLATEHDLIEKNHKCPECNKKFYTKHRLIEHAETVHMKIADLHKCRLCSKLCKHITTHMIHDAHTWS